MARPTKEKSPVTRVFSWRATEEEGAKMDALVQASGYKPSEFQRKVFLENKPVMQTGEGEKTSGTNKTKEQQKIIFLLAQLGNNVNQIAHNLNSDRKAGIVSAHLYQSILEQLEQIANHAKDLRE